MPLLRQMAHAYVQHRLLSPPVAPSTRNGRAAPDAPAPLRWLRDLGLDAAGRLGERGGVRASDADREHVVDFLKQHSAEGRLSTEELTSRVEAAYSAASLAQLDRLTADLPGSPFVPEAPPAQHGRVAGPAAHLAAIGVALTVLLTLVGILLPPELWAALLMLVVPLGALAVISLLPFALPLLALLLLARGGAGHRALDRGSRRHLTVDRRGSVHVWRL